MSTIEKSIEVGVPASVAYAQWTQFETFPRFMHGVESVEQIDDTHLRWRANVAGTVEEWDAEIDEQIPDARIAWHSTSGAPNAGVVTFHRLTDESARVMLQLKYEPQTWAESLGDMLGVLSHRIEGDLRRFKDFIEARQEPTGSWRGEVQAPADRR